MMETKYIIRSTAYALLTAVAIGGSIYLYSQTSEMQFGKFAPEYRRDMNFIDSVYTAKKDSIKAIYTKKHLQEIKESLEKMLDE
jgi:hypothetical protein